MASLVLAAIWGAGEEVVVVGGGWRVHMFLRKAKNGEDVSCGTERDDSAVGMLWKFNDVLMAPQGHGAGATSQEGACENSNLERQGCSPFYQELIDDPYVDPVSGLKPVCLTAHYFFFLFKFLFFLFLLLFSPSGHLLKLQQQCLSRFMT